VYSFARLLIGQTGWRVSGDSKTREPLSAFLSLVSGRWRQWYPGGIEATCRRNTAKPLLRGANSGLWSGINLEKKRLNKSAVTLLGAKPASCDASHGTA